MNLQLKKLITFSPTLLMLVVFSVQVFRAKVYHQTPWKGGGFGMFSSVDGRFLKIYAKIKDQGERKVPLTIPKSIVRENDLFLSFPSKANAEILAKAILNKDWELSFDGGNLQSVNNSQSLDIPMEEIAFLSIEFWEYNFSSDGPKLTSTKSSQFKFEAGFDHE